MGLCLVSYCQIQQNIATWGGSPWKGGRLINEWALNNKFIHCLGSIDTTALSILNSLVKNLIKPGMTFRKPK